MNILMPEKGDIIMMKIVHLSDLHIGGSNFVSEWGDRVIKMVNSIDPQILVITGDLTSNGYVDEYEKASKFLDRFVIKNMLVVPGNHDAGNMGYEIFEEIFKTRFPYFKNDKVLILGIDSSEPDIDDGHIGRENYAFIREKLSVDNKIKILAMHHHLIPIPGTGREKNILVDAGEVLKLCIELKVDFVLSGHKHLPWIWKLENTNLVTAGTATSRKLKGRTYPSFNLLEIEKEYMVIKEINVLEGSFKEILRERISPTLIKEPLLV